MSGREKSRQASKAGALSPRRARPNAELKAELDRNLIEGRLANYEALAKWLGSQGCKIVAGRHRSAIAASSNRS